LHVSAMLVKEIRPPNGLGQDNSNTFISAGAKIDQ
jgi:hypothetical protein